LQTQTNSESACIAEHLFSLHGTPGKHCFHQSTNSHQLKSFYNYHWFVKHNSL